MQRIVNVYRKTTNHPWKKPPLSAAVLYRRDRHHEGGLDGTAAGHTRNRQPDLRTELWNGKNKLEHELVALLYLNRFAMNTPGAMGRLGTGSVR